MENRHGPSRRFRCGVPSLNEAKDIGSNFWRVNAIVTAVQGEDELAKDTPDEALLGSLALEL